MKRNQKRTVPNRHPTAHVGRLVVETCVKRGLKPRALTLHSEPSSPMAAWRTGQLMVGFGVPESLSRPWDSVEVHS